jgi:Type III flagellar switch regulator (C-ring) FliN C-term
MAAVATMPVKDVRVAEPAASSALATTPPRELSRQGGTAMERIEEHPDWPLLQRLPMRLSAGIPLPGFRVRDLVGLKPGLMLRSSWLSTDDVPLKIGSVQLSWSEFEVVEQRMAIRLTRLA